MVAVRGPLSRALDAALPPDTLFLMHRTDALLLTSSLGLAILGRGISSVGERRRAR
jgi:hypothetical protein